MARKRVYKIQIKKPPGGRIWNIYCPCCDVVWFEGVWAWAMGTALFHIRDRHVL